MSGFVGFRGSVYSVDGVGVGVSEIAGDEQQDTARDRGRFDITSGIQCDGDGVHVHCCGILFRKRSIALFGLLLSLIILFSICGTVILYTVLRD